MASPTEAEAITQLTNATHILEEAREFGESDATNLLGVLDTYDQAIEGDYASDMAAASAGFRSSYASLLVRNRIRALINPALRHWGKAIGAPETNGDPLAILERIYDQMQDVTSDRISSRVFTFGAPAAITGTGDGVLRRLTVNEDAHDLEAAFAETKTFECLRDQSSGAEEHEEVFEVRGEDAGRDPIELLGSGGLTQIRAQSARDSLLLNASFSNFSGTIASPTAITNWTVGTSIANFQIDQTNFYRDFPGDTTPASLVFETNDTISQQLNVRRTRLRADRPYYLQVAFNREVGSADGTLRIRMGSQTTTVALAAQTGWNLLFIPIDENLWFNNFNEQDLDIQIALESNTTGTLLVDDVLFLPWSLIDGTYWLMIGGATPFLFEDLTTAADTESATGVIQRWLWRGYNFWLPHSTGGGITIADP